METLFHSRQSHESVDQSDSRGAVVVETLQFTDRSTSDPVEKARRYLIAMGDHRINSAYFYDDGYPKQASASDALATLAVLEQLVAQTSASPSPAAQGDALDAAFEAVRKRLCGVQRYSFVLDDDGLIRRVQDRVGNWIEFDDAHELFDPVAIDAARAAQEGNKP